MSPQSPSLLTDSTVPRRRQLCDEPHKTTYDGPSPETHVLYFKDDIAIHNRLYTINGKGVLNNRISELLMTRLNGLRIETHFIRSLNMREQLVRATEILPFKLTLHNVASQTFAKRLGLKENVVLPKPIPEFSLSCEKLGQPVVSTEHLTALGWSRFEEIDDILLMSQRINDFLIGQFLALNMRLVNFTLSLGRIYTTDLEDSHVVITDALCPDTLHLFDLTTNKHFHQEEIARNPEYAQEIYQEVARRLGVFSIDSIQTPASLLEAPAIVPTFSKRKSPSWP